eukprot:UN26205
MILNDVSLSKDVLEDSKQAVKEIVSKENMEPFLDENSSSIDLLPGARRALTAVRNPQEKISQIMKIVDEIVLHLENLFHQRSKRVPYFNETLKGMLWRWRKFKHELWNFDKEEFDYTKIPDVFDCVRYDLRHNHHILKETNILQLWDLAEVMANFVIPQEYGITKQQKLEVSAGICSRLFEKIAANLQAAVDTID